MVRRQAAGIRRTCCFPGRSTMSSVLMMLVEVVGAFFFGFATLNSTGGFRAHVPGRIGRI